MPSDPQLELRVSRLENDRDALYELLTGISSTQQGHSRRLDRIDGRLDRMDTRFDGIDTQLESIQSTLVEVVRRLPEQL